MDSTVSNGVRGGLAASVHIPSSLYSFQGHFGSRGWKRYNPTGKVLSCTQSQGPPNSQLRVLTFNIWFEAIFKEQRTREVIRLIQELNPDVCCFQEVTPMFEDILRRDPHWRKSWAMTGLADQLAFTRSMYGTMIVVKKALISAEGRFSANAFFVGLPGTTTGRCLTVLELSPRIVQGPAIRIGTVHLDYTPELRATHFSVAIQALSFSSIGPPPACILCGDTNISSYSEITPLLEEGFSDSWLTAHPTDGDAPNLMLVAPTYGQTGIRKRESKAEREEVAKRLDLILCRGFKVLDCNLIGKEPIRSSGTGIEDLNDWMIFPSDHAGVFTDLSVQ